MWTRKRLSWQFSGVLFSKVCTAHKGLKLIRMMDWKWTEWSPVSLGRLWLVFNITQRDKYSLIPFIRGI